MKRLALAGFAAAWILSAALVRAQEPKESLFDTIHSFRPARESNMGAGSGYYLYEAVEEILRQQSLAPTKPAEIEPEAPDVAALSKQALNRLVAGYNNRLIAPMMRSLHPEYRVDPGLFREALVSDFRLYEQISLRVDIDKIDVLPGDEALIQFRYRLSVRRNGSAAVEPFTGTTRMLFKMNEAKAQLIQQYAPMIFGASAPASDIPRFEAQGPAATAGSAGPACATPASGRRTMLDVTEGFLFRTQQVVPMAASELFKAGAQLRMTAGSGIKAMGSGPLKDIKFLPNGGFSTVTVAVVGQRYGIRTRDLKAAVIRLESFGFDDAGSAIMTFEYRLQTTAGVRCFP